MTSDTIFERVARNVRDVRQRIGEAAVRSGRSPESVKLIAVSKYAATGDAAIDALLEAGCRDLGEARPQQLLEKAEFYRPKPINWHLIGTLQRNKARKILPHTALIHSLNSLRLAEALDRIVDEEGQHAAGPPRPVRCLLEIAISGEQTKHGFRPEDAPAAVDRLGRLPNIRVEGLMCMSGLESDDSETRRQFEAVRRLSESLRTRGTPPNVVLDELSMGMSDDFETAVEEGATIVRIGSRLFA